MKLVAISAMFLLAACPSKKDRDRYTDGVLAKMTEFSDQMCACKDKACADKVQEVMTKWGQDMAKNAPNAHDYKPDVAKVKKLTEVATRYAECMTKLVVSEAPPEKPHADLPPPSAKPDADTLIRSAREWVRSERPQHLLLEVSVWYVDASGALDDTHGKLRATFGRSASTGDDPKRKTGAPVVAPATFNDCFGLTWDRQRGWTKVPAPCEKGYEAGIQCPITEIWKRAIASGAPADALATITLKALPEKRFWGFWITDEPRNVHISDSFPDDCPITVEK